MFGLTSRATYVSGLTTIRARSQPAKMSSRTCADGWRSLQTPPSELTLHFTLPTGQSFRWRETGEREYTGVIGSRVVSMRQTEDDVLWRVLAHGAGSCADVDDAVIADYFNLNVNLTEKAATWAANDKRFAAINPYIHGCRLLRQDPVECVFEFICSSNNHISRIHGMVEHLCSRYGTPLMLASDAEVPTSSAQSGLVYNAFPTIEQLSAATEADLRSAGFGYRARYIVESAKMLAAKPEGGAAWLHSLRGMECGDAVEQLMTLSGVGPKVAACIALFSCDKHAAIPVDTHVWKIACKYYTPALRGKTLTPKIHPMIMQAFVDVFGEYAGWAHNALFISELASHKKYLPDGSAQASPKQKRKRPSQSGRSSLDGDSSSSKRSSATGDGLLVGAGDSHTVKTELDTSPIKNTRPRIASGLAQHEDAVLSMLDPATHHIKVEAV